MMTPESLCKFLSVFLKSEFARNQMKIQQLVAQYHDCNKPMQRFLYRCITLNHVVIMFYHGEKSMFNFYRVLGLIFLLQ